MKIKHIALGLLAVLFSAFLIAQTNLPSVNVGTAETVTRQKKDVLVSLTITENTITASFERQQVDPATGEVIRIITSGSTSRKIEAIKSQAITDAITLLSTRAQNWYDADRNPKQP